MPAPYVPLVKSNKDLSNFDELDAIRDALVAGEKVGTEDIPVKIKVIAPPLYVMLTTALEKPSNCAASTRKITASAIA